MDQIIQSALDFANANISIAPWILFGLLLLAGFNIPISEDVMNFAAGFLASQNPDQLAPIYLGLFLGAYFSDLISYGLGRFVGPSLFKIKWFSKMVTPGRLAQINGFFNRYGMITLILGRFVPGIRNPLFMSCGLSKMNVIKFALADFIAAALSVTSYFYLYYSFGEAIKDTIKRANAAIFVFAIIVVILLFVRKRMAAKRIEPQE